MLIVYMIIAGIMSLCWGVKFIEKSEELKKLNTPEAKALNVFCNIYIAILMLFAFISLGNVIIRIFMLMSA